MNIPLCFVCPSQMLDNGMTTDAIGTGDKGNLSGLLDHSDRCDLGYGVLSSV